MAVLSGKGTGTVGCRLKTVAVGEKYMKNPVGLWIDHRKAAIVLLSDKGEETRVLESKAVETEDAMTDRRIAAKVREYFHWKGD